LDEVFVKINGKLCYLWRPVDHEGEVLETVVTAKRDKAAALKFLKREHHEEVWPPAERRRGRALFLSRGDERDRQRRSSRDWSSAQQSRGEFASAVSTTRAAPQRFRSAKPLQKFSSVHAQVHNLFNQERHLVTREVYKQRRLAALTEWRALAA
jgi:putative transposase